VFPRSGGEFFLAVLVGCQQDAPFSFEAGQQGSRGNLGLCAVLPRPQDGGNSYLHDGAQVASLQIETNGIVASVADGIKRDRTLDAGQVLSKHLGKRLCSLVHRRPPRGKDILFATDRVPLIVDRKFVKRHHAHQNDVTILKNS